MTTEAKPVTSAFVLLGLTNSVFHRSVRCSAFCPSLAITIEIQNNISILVLRSGAIAEGDEWMKSPTAQMPNVTGKPMATIIKFVSGFCLLIISACNSHTDTTKSVTPKSTNQVTCIPYFEFDHIDHYRLNMDEDELWDIEQKKIKTEKEKGQLELLIQYTPDKLSDSSILRNIEKLGFVKNEVPADKFTQIKEIFCQRKHKEVYWLSCVAVYRDILVFKKENEIIGIAKICFSCDQNVISGTTLNTEEFGQSGDYKKLLQLLSD